MESAVVLERTTELWTRLVDAMSGRDDNDDLTEFEFAELKAKIGLKATMSRQVAGHFTLLTRPPCNAALLQH